MTIKQKKQWQKERREFWKQAYLATVASSNCVANEVPKDWANRALVELDKKFNPEEE